MRGGDDGSAGKTISFPPEQLKWIDAQADATKRSRSAWIQWALDRVKEGKPVPVEEVCLPAKEEKESAATLREEKPVRNESVHERRNQEKETPADQKPAGEHIKYPVPPKKEAKEIIAARKARGAKSHVADDPHKPTHRAGKSTNHPEKREE